MNDGFAEMKEAEKKYKRLMGTDQFTEAYRDFVDKYNAWLDNTSQDPVVLQKLTY